MLPLLNTTLRSSVADLKTYILEHCVLSNITYFLKDDIQHLDLFQEVQDDSHPIYFTYSQLIPNSLVSLIQLYTRKLSATQKLFTYLPANFSWTIQGSFGTFIIRNYMTGNACCI